MFYSPAWHRSWVWTVRGQHVLPFRCLKLVDWNAAADHGTVGVRCFRMIDHLSQRGRWYCEEFHILSAEHLQGRLYGPGLGEGALNLI